MAAIPMLRRKQIIFKLLSVLVSTGIVLVACEWILRMRDPLRRLPRDQIFGSPPLTWGHPIRNNRFGFRERDFVIPKPRGTYRIMVLGDSLTWGHGIAEEHRFTNLLEKNLKERFPKQAIEVLNFGFVGASTLGEKIILKRFGKAAEPDQIVLAFCLNDPQPRKQEYSFERETFERYADPALNRIESLGQRIGFVKLGQVFKKSMFNLAEACGIFPDWLTALDRAYDRNSEEWRYFVSDLAGIRGMSDSLGLPAPIFAVLNQPLYNDRPTNYQHPDAKTAMSLRWLHQAMQAASRCKYRTLDFEKEFSERFYDQIPIANELDSHPSVDVNRMYADKFTDFIAHGLK